MQHSALLARILGPLLLVSALGILVNRAAFRATAEALMLDRGLIYFTGIIALASGLLIIEFHNVWVWGWPVLITLLGWLSLLRGILRMIFPDRIAALGASMLDRTALITVIGIVTLAAGGFLTVMGYRA